jgi:hypothetical protein
MVQKYSRVTLYVLPNTGARVSVLRQDYICSILKHRYNLITI